MLSNGLDLEVVPVLAGGVIQDPLDLKGPSLPRMQALEGNPGHIIIEPGAKLPPAHEVSVSSVIVSSLSSSLLRPATEAERSGGYMEQLGCYRALQEAMAGLFYVPGK